MQAYCKPVLGLSSLRSAAFVEFFGSTNRSSSALGTTSTWRPVELCLFGPITPCLASLRRSSTRFTSP